MRYGTIAGVDKPLSRLVVGARGFEDEGACFAHFDACFEAGYTVWDTARSYYEGGTDRLIGRWMQSRGNRERVAVLAKGCMDGLGGKRMTPRDLEADLRASLNDLDAGFVDLFLLHRDDPGAEVGPIVEALHGHWEAGRIGAYGASNWSHARVGEANAYAERHGLRPFAVSGPQLSLLERQATEIHWWRDCPGIGGDAGQTARAWYRDNGIAVIGYSVLGAGFLDGSLTPALLPARLAAGALPDWSVDAWVSDGNVARLARAFAMAEHKGLTVAQVALRYVSSLAANGLLDAYAIAASERADRMVDNAIAADEDFTAGEIAWLERGEAIRELDPASDPQRENRLLNEEGRSAC
ncbi:aldo/keto reductase [Cohnella hashimotonis]|uniref:Aldo/keto reductase n=1 Tax=Cohnella hashimotonis TaxID=2826895 RepID=A0ABT6TN45_9BACL|nr:aldo/keto reductase [Cohnella hashimotonis]MDI4647262.1 aldo/keto reductase [Cohnella hashimotonis]